MDLSLRNGWLRGQLHSRVPRARSTPQISVTKAVADFSLALERDEREAVTAIQAAVVLQVLQIPVAPQTIPIQAVAPAKVKKKRKSLNQACQPSLEGD